MPDHDEFFVRYFDFMLPTISYKYAVVYKIKID